MAKLSSTQISKKSKMIAATAFILGMLAIGGTAFADAPAKGASHDRLVEAIAKRFNLTSRDVQAVVDEVLTENRAERAVELEKVFEQHMTDEVAEGRLTQAQADLIIAKEKELHVSMESIRGMSPKDRQVAHRKLMQDLKQWMDDNNIPESAIRGWGFGGPGHGMKNK